MVSGGKEGGGNRGEAGEVLGVFGQDRSDDQLTLSLERSQHFFQVAFAHDAQFRVLCFFGLVLLGVDVQATVQLLACL